jgi:beta-glucosidase/6-phospho-beta-glucosidase/beta-galactosidase
MSQPGATTSHPHADRSGNFIFATGIECSYPTIAGPNGRRVRVDELDKTFHYRHWQHDLALVRDLGLQYLRYGPPYHCVHTGPDRYDWEFTDLVFAEMRRLEITPIVDLCHFGVPDWIGDFQNRDWPEQFARYAAAFAQRFPWVQLYTPVNEIYVCAKLSTLDGIWNERKKDDDRAFVTALTNLCKANLLSIEAIAKLRPDAIFIQSESAEHFHPGGSDPAVVKIAKRENERRFLSFDLLFSVSPSLDMGLYLLDNGLARADFEWFMRHGLGERIVMGNDFYERNEQIVTPRGEIEPAGEIFGWSVITRQYYERYRRPVMHTETNIADAEKAPRWLWKEFFNVRNLRDQGLPVFGFTWYSLIDQVDWDCALAFDRGAVNPVGLFDLKRQPRPVAAAFKEMLRQFGPDPLLPGSRAFALHQGTGPPPTQAAIRPKPQHTLDGMPPAPAARDGGHRAHDK